MGVEMQKSTYKVAQMDCGAEEALVRMKLQPINAIRGLEFDLSRRQVTVYHVDELAPIETALHELNLEATRLSTEQSEYTGDGATIQRRTLWAVLIINFAFFVIEVAFGFISGSLGLVADSLDMLADAIVYGLSLAAVGAAVSRKRSVATISGYFQLSLATLGFLEVIRRFVSVEVAPDFRVMIAISLLALIANSVSLYLLQRSRSREVHMQASMIFTSNDVIINIGVIVAGLLVYWLHSPIPDLIVGAIVFVLVMRGAVRILRLAR